MHVSTSFLQIKRGVHQVGIQEPPEAGVVIKRRLVSGWNKPDQRAHIGTRTIPPVAPGGA